MIHEAEIACYSDRHLAMAAVDEVMSELGFETVPTADPNARRFRNTKPWYTLDASTSLLATEASFRVENLSLFLEVDLGNVKARTVQLCWAVGLAGLLLVLGTLAWSVVEHSWTKALAPIAPWPFLVPLMHRSMNRMGRKRWDQILRLIGRTASAHEAELSRRNKSVAAQRHVDGDQTIAS